MTRLRVLIAFLVLCSSLVIPITHYGRISSPKNHHVSLFFFGDSYFGAGNNNYINTSTDYQANFLPYGETFFNNPTGRFSDGRIISDFIAEYANLPLISTFLPTYHLQNTCGVNFASAGAGALFETHRALVIDFESQLSYFNIVEKQLKQKLGYARAKTLLSKAIYLFSIGSNDYFALFTTNSNVLQSHNCKKEYVAMVIGNLSTTIKELYNKGGRKIWVSKFGAFGLCIPSMKTMVPGSTGSCLEDALELAKLHNEALSQLLQELESKLKGLKYANHNFYNSLIERINYPSNYGFKEAMACCGSGRYRGILSCGGNRAIKEYELCAIPVKICSSMVII